MRTELCTAVAVVQVVVDRLCQHVLSHHEEFMAGVESVGEVENDLMVSYARGQWDGWRKPAMQERCQQNALPCPALPCPALPCPALPCPALPCPALPCPALPRPALRGCAPFWCIVVSLATTRGRGNHRLGNNPEVSSRSRFYLVRHSVPPCGGATHIGYRGAARNNMPRYTHALCFGFDAIPA